jgi:hypothetical protein
VTYTTTDVIVTVSCWNGKYRNQNRSNADTLAGRNFSIANGTVRLRVQLSTITMPTVATITLSATEGSDVAWPYLEQPFCRYRILVLNKWYGGKCGLHIIDVTVVRCTTGTVSVPTADTIDEVDETFSIANGTVSATGTIHNNAPTVATITLLRLPKDLDGIRLYIEQPFCRYSYTLF